MDLKELFGFEGKNVVITGAGSGMGLAATKLLVELGANVYATVRNNPLDFAVTKEIKTDLGDPQNLDALSHQLPPDIDALFLCHGISNTFGKTNALQVNLTKFYSFKYLTEKLLPRIVDEGSVTFISSDGGRRWRDSIADCLGIINCPSWDEALAWYKSHPEATGDGYVFAKKCQNVYVMSKAQTPEFIDRKIRLNAILPGFTITGLSDDFNKSVNGDMESGKAQLEKALLRPWNGRAASPEEMGHPLVAVGSKLFSYLSGQLIFINYGSSSRADFNDLLESL
jgi:NAD(P)-dependent dehydrogenase (short-subunit alcohol dehydrogenase family)